MSWIDDLINSNKGLKGPYDQQVSPVVTPSNPSGVGTGQAALYGLLAKLLTAAPANPMVDAITALRTVPHYGVGGALVTPNNPTGNPANPWAPGGAFANNPVHRAALAMQGLDPDSV